jgi:hypothetical protein
VGCGWDAQWLLKGFGDLVFGQVTDFFAELPFGLGESVGVAVVDSFGREHEDGEFVVGIFGVGSDGSIVGKRGKGFGDVSCCELAVAHGCLESLLCLLGWVLKESGIFVVRFCGWAFLVDCLGCIDDHLLGLFGKAGPSCFGFSCAAFQ